MKKKVLAWLLAATLSYFVFGDSLSQSNSLTYLAYPLASVTVMLVLAVVTEVLYGRREPAHKVGAASVLTLIHVVLYVLAAVGSLIAALFALISYLLSSDTTGTTEKGMHVMLWTGLAVAVIFGLTAARIMFGGGKSLLRKVQLIVMVAAAVGTIAACILGPVVTLQVTKDDRLIEAGLPSLDSAIQYYTYENGKLPERFDQLNLDNVYTRESEVGQLVARNLVEYTPNSKTSTPIDTPSPIDKSTSPVAGVSLSYSKLHFYQLCVTFQRAKQSERSGGIEIMPAVDSSSTGIGTSGSSSSLYLEINKHDKGRVCYDRQVAT